MLFLVHLALCSAVKHWMFRRCDQNPFCERNREYANAVSVGEADPRIYGVDPRSLDVSDPHRITGEIRKRLSPEDASAAVGAENGVVRLPFTLEIVSDAAVRFLVDERGRSLADLPDIQLSEKLNASRYDPAPLVLVGADADGRIDSRATARARVARNNTALTVHFGRNNAVVLDFATLALTLLRDNEPQLVLNRQGLFNVEHLRRRNPDDRGGREWVDRFDKYTDRRVRGPESVALDSFFVGFDHLYGIPEHADSLSLRDTAGTNDPYRLFNVDIFEYETESPMPMYGSIPLLTAHKPGTAAGVFWLNAADTYVDIDHLDSTGRSAGSSAHWISETGKLDVFLFVGDEPADVLYEYGLLTGTAQLPQQFAIGYHQCRWNYLSQEELLQVNREMDKNAFPYDVIWLDIEWTNDRRYFEWDEEAFPDPEEMMAELNQTHRKLVVLNDPHIKATEEYSAFVSLENEEVLVRDTMGVNNYLAYCWPGKSAWIDTFNPALQAVWRRLHALGTKLGGFARNLHLWSDMSEPSVFSGSETTAYKGVVHHGGWQHRDVHNVYGHTVFDATYDALLHRYNGTQRPFVLTRSFFAGSQQLGPTWTGDNQAEWQYLKAATPMILTLGISGYPFGGADVGGFFRNPSDELLVRWYQAGCFYPFFRAHAHIESKYREPYLLEPAHQTIVRDALNLRYQLLPYFYTLFRDAHERLQPVLRPMYYVYPHLSSDAIKTEQDQFFVGDALVARPVVDAEASAVDVLLPAEDVFYDYHTGAKVDNKRGIVTVPVDLSTLPLFVRGGSAVFRRDRQRRSAELMQNDPYTLLVALDSNGEAKGHLYSDDGVSFRYETEQDFVITEVSVSHGVISGKTQHQSKSGFAYVPIERIIVYGGKTPSRATHGRTNLDVIEGENMYTVRNPRVEIGSDWKINLIM